MSDDTKTPIEEVVERVTASIEEREAQLAKEREAFQLEMRSRMDELEKIAAANLASHKVVDEEEPVSFGRIIHALTLQAQGKRNAWDTAKAGREREIIEQFETQRTAMSVQQDSMGGFWVPEQYMPQEFVEYFRAAMVLPQLGARMMSGLTGSPVIFPKQTGGATAYWVAENAAITESNLTAGDIKMEPHQLGALVKMSNRLDMLSNPGAEGLIRQDIANSLAEELEKAAIGNSVQAGAPDGIIGTAGIGSTSTASINVTNALAMEYQLEQDDALRGRLGWLMHPRPWSTIRGRYRTKTVEFQGVAQNGPSAAFPESYIGYPVARTTNVRAVASSTSDVYFANWAELLIGQWGGLAFAVSTEADTAFAANQIWIRAIMEVDFAVRHAESFCVNASVTD